MTLEESKEIKKRIKFERHYPEALSSIYLDNVKMFRFFETRAKQLEYQNFQIDENFQIDMIKKLDHITLILEEFLNTNREIVSKLNNLISFNPEEQQTLNEKEMIEIQDLPDNTIEQIIFDYLKKYRHKKVYPSEIAFAFNLDARKVFDICQKLKKEGDLV